MPVYQNFELGYHYMDESLTEPKGWRPAVSFKNLDQMSLVTRDKLLLILEAILDTKLFVARKVEQPSPMAMARVFRTILSRKCDRQVANFFELPDGVHAVWKGNRNYFLESDSGDLKRLWTTNGVIEFPFTTSVHGKVIVHTFRAKQDASYLRRWNIGHYMDGDSIHAANGQSSPSGVQYIIGRLTRSLVPDTVPYKALSRLHMPDTPFLDEYAKESMKLGLVFHSTYPRLTRDDLRTNRPRIRALNALKYQGSRRVDNVPCLPGLQGLSFIEPGELLNQYTEEVCLPTYHKDKLVFKVNSFLGVAGNDIIIPYEMVMDKAFKQRNERVCSTDVKEV